MEVESTGSYKILRILTKARDERAAKNGNERNDGEEGLVKELRKSISVRGFGRCKVTRYEFAFKQ